jgi:CRISPR/Cas system-associated protein Csx1
LGIVENLTLSIYVNCHYCTYVIEFISLILLFYELEFIV